MYWQKRFNESNPDEEIEHLIKEIFKENNGNYGYRRICMELRKCGHIVNHKKVLRIMNKLNLTCTKFTRKSRKYNSYKGTVGKVAQNRINRRFNTHIPYQKITTDTTEFKYYTKDQSGKTVIKKAYLDPFLDMFNGEILSYRLSQRPSAKAILDALNETIIITKECPYRTTIHTDQGWGYQMKAFRKRLKDNKIFQSMSRRGNCLDNSPMENFFGLMKQEMYYGVIYESFEELKQAVDKYIYYYNNRRIKVKLTGMSPVEYRKQASQLVA
ncbi:putative transposase [Amphibacillus xylanus NBRC 15112]|uniref:Putative transposase n=2 Tax=Amphibacillus xylanus TaxID=1449 RepID=K0IWL3_AMPXN|nr:putative transposase [Amphibacillus xylanus NBRC 15112]